MTFKILILLCSVLTFVNFGCSRSQSVDPAAAQRVLADAWSAPQHTVWEIEWSAIPLSAPLTVESWRSGSRYRFEILEATAPALVGQAVMFDGEQGWQYNRFEPAASLTSTVTGLSPVSDVFDAIARRLEEKPETAVEKMEPVDSVSVRKVTLTFTNGDHLSMWIAAESGLPLRVEIDIGGQLALLQARRTTALADDAPASLFRAGSWLENVK